MPLTAPLVIAAGARILVPHKVPEIEQLLAAVAGVMNLLNAFHAQGFGAIWLTGGNAYDREVADTLGISIGTVMSRLFYARLKLRSLLAAGAHVE